MNETGIPEHCSLSALQHGAKTYQDAQVIPLEPGEIEEQLRMARDETSPGTFQGIVDHAHGSYSLDLDAAARQLEKQGL